MICEVCGERATGYHYDVISCGGCKTFFRRAIISQREFECNRDGNCRKGGTKFVCIDCRKCRFDKCVEVGMNPLAIQAVKEPANNLLITKVMKHRGQLIDGRSDMELTIIDSPQTVEMAMDRLIFEMISVEHGHQRLRRSIYMPSESSQSLEELLVGHSRLGVDYGDSIYIPLNAAPRLVFIPMEIRIRDRIPIGFIPPKKRGFKFWPHEDIGYTIEYLKALPIFHQLETKDKLVLTRHVVCMCSLLTTAFSSYERQSGCTVYPDGSTIRDGTLAREAVLEREVHLGVINFLREANLDVNEYVILKGLLVCNPAIEGLSPSAQITLAKEQRILGKTLLSYLIARRGISQGPTSYVEVLSLLSNLISLSKRQKEQHILSVSLGILRLSKRILIDDIYQL